MVLQIILVDILLIARIFPRPCRAQKNTMQLIKYLCILSVKPLNKVYLLHVYGWQRVHSQDGAILPRLGLPITSAPVNILILEMVSKQFKKCQRQIKVFTVFGFTL